MIESKLRGANSGGGGGLTAKSFGITTMDLSVNHALVVSNLNAINLLIGGHPDTTFASGIGLNGAYDAMFYGTGSGSLGPTGSSWVDTHNAGGGLIVGTFQAGSYQAGHSNIGDMYTFFTSVTYSPMTNHPFTVPSGNAISDTAGVTSGIHNYYGADTLSAANGGTAFGNVPAMNNGAEWVQYDNGTNRYIANQISAHDGPNSLQTSSYTTELSAYKLLVAQLYWVARGI